MNNKMSFTPCAVPILSQWGQSYLKFALDFKKQFPQIHLIDLYRLNRIQKVFEKWVLTCTRDSLVSTISISVDPGLVRFINCSKCGHSPI